MKVTLAGFDTFGACANQPPTAVLVNEFDSRFLQSSPDFASGCLPAAEPAFRGFHSLSIFLNT